MTTDLDWALAAAQAIVEPEGGSYVPRRWVKIAQALLDQHEMMQDCHALVADITDGLAHNDSVSTAMMRAHLRQGEDLAAARAEVAALRARQDAVEALHVAGRLGSTDWCWECNVAAPCPTRAALQGGTA